MCFLFTGEELVFVEHQLALKTTIPRDVFNILLCTSDIFFCMKSDICPVNILQPPLCTEKKKRKKLYFDQENDAWKVIYYGAAAKADEEPECPLQAGGGKT